MDREAHWEKVYGTKAPNAVSWYRPHLETSLALVERAAYVRQVLQTMKRGGHVIISTFGPEGPEKCSGLDVMRYDAGAPHAELGARFRLVESSKEIHQTPFGTTQQFLSCYCRVE